MLFRSQLARPVILARENVQESGRKPAKSCQIGRPKSPEFPDMHGNPGSHRKHSETGGAERPARCHSDSRCEKNSVATETRRPQRQEADLGARRSDISQCEWRAKHMRREEERLSGRDGIMYNEKCKMQSVRSEEHTSELQSHSFISYAVFCLKKKKKYIKKK